MEEQDLLVSGEADIGLHLGSAHVGGFSKGRHRVLGGVGTGAAMGDDVKGLRECHGDGGFSW